MEQVELVCTTGSLSFGIQPQHQIGIALGIDHDHDMPRVNVLGGQHLQHACLAHPRGAQHDHVAGA